MHFRPSPPLAGGRRCLVGALLPFLFALAQTVTADWVVHSFPSGQSPRDLAYSPTLDRFVAVGSYGVIRYSADGQTWETPVIEMDRHELFDRVVWSPELSRFGAVGQSGEFQWSTDGINWTRPAPAPWTYDSLYGGTNGPQGLVFVGSDGMVLTCDGSGTSARAQLQFGGPRPRLWAIGYLPALGRYVAASSQRFYTCDGDPATVANWQQVDYTPPGNIAHLAAGAGWVVAAAPAGTILYSSDGIAWSTATANTTLPFTKVFHAAGEFYLSGEEYVTGQGYDGIFGKFDPTTGTFTAETIPAIRFYGYAVNQRGDRVGVGNRKTGSACSMTLAQPPPPFTLWDDAVDAAGGWKWYAKPDRTWEFGWFLDYGQGWIHHQQHGWWWCGGDTVASFFAWDWNLDSWIWLSSALYPYFYNFAGVPGWGYFSDGIAPQRHLFDFRHNPARYEPEADFRDATDLPGRAPKTWPLGSTWRVVREVEGLGPVPADWVVETATSGTLTESDYSVPFHYQNYRARGDTIDVECRVPDWHMENVRLTLVFTSDTAGTFSGSSLTDGLPETFSGTFERIGP